VIGPPPAGGIASANSTGSIRRAPRRQRAASGPTQDGASEALVSPIQGTVLRVDVKKGQEVDPGAVICVIEAMKMENEITAHRAGKVAELNVTEGGSVASGDTIAVIK
jgi:acetyl-CoA/propionyl-CoA carboxylase biotin carboxyl carrier protein